MNAEVSLCVIAAPSWRTPATSLISMSASHVGKTRLLQRTRHDEARDWPLTCAGTKSPPSAAHRFRRAGGWSCVCMQMKGRSALIIMKTNKPATSQIFHLALAGRCHRSAVPLEVDSRSSSPGFSNVMALCKPRGNRPGCVTTASSQRNAQETSEFGALHLASFQGNVYKCFSLIVLWLLWIKASA